MYLVNNLSIAVPALPMLMLTSILVNKIMLPRYIKWSTHFKGLPFNEEMEPSWLKHELCLIKIRSETNVSCCLLQTIQHIFGLSRCTWKTSLHQYYFQRDIVCLLNINEMLIVTVEKNIGKTKQVFKMFYNATTAWHLVKYISSHPPKDTRFIDKN